MATHNKNVADGFPALKKLGFPTGRRSVPFVQQLEWTDCGAASLCMVMAYHGRETKLAEVRDAMGIGRDGVSAKAILDTAERYGLTGRGIKVDTSQVKLLKTATILHWEFNHFVVFDRVVPGGVRIVDPATGPRDVPMDQFGKAFTGVAIELIPTDRFTKTKREKGRLTRYVQELLSEKGLASRIIVISLALRLIALALPLITGMIIDQVVPRADYDLLYVVLGAIGGMTAFNLIADIVRTHLLLHLRIALDTRMTLGFLDHMVSLPYQFFQRRSTGDLMMRVDSNGTVRETVTSKSMSAVLDGVFVMLYAVVIFYVSPLLGVITILMSAAEALVFLCARPTYQRLLAADLDKGAKTHSYMIQMLGGMETLKCAGAERLGVEKWSNLYTDELNVKMRRARVTAYVDGIRGAVAALGPLLILTIGATSVMSGKMSLGMMLAMNSLATSLFTPLSALVSSALDLQLVKGHMDRIDDVLQTPVEQDRDAVATPPRLRGHVSVKNLSFKYGDQAPLVVQDVSLDIVPGMSVALVGPSGSGKSTLLNILAGLYKPVTGEVHYDGRPLHDMDVRAVRQQIGIVPQHPFIFGGTLRENVALTAPGAQLDRVTAACKVSCLHDDIAEMPMGYDTVISDGGGSLSGGQRQRVAIARAVIRNPSLMLLDEATSALDNSTEKRVIENLERQRCTRITVAHRLSTVRNADLIVVMDKGRIIEQGNHHQLLAASGLYARLVAASQNPTTELPPNGYQAIPVGNAAPGGVRSTRSAAHRA
ncbi:MAG TPA: peptidase domain-containing ABC transporter [Kofleriaceae bacterium]|jgi:ABC-type bacteriocin/lantibiotic exporter with double-glycine peptidase domain|nr:peptidase domain-containing ABC transporter [Kofleriaceae bacterium]